MLQYSACKNSERHIFQDGGSMCKQIISFLHVAYSPSLPDTYRLHSFLPVISVDAILIVCNFRCKLYCCGVLFLGIRGLYDLSARCPWLALAELAMSPSTMEICAWVALEWVKCSRTKQAVREVFIFSFSFTAHMVTDGVIIKLYTK